MRNRERITSIRRHSTGRVSRENLWFFSEDTVLNSTPTSEKRIVKNDSLRPIKENFDTSMSKTSERNRLKKECTFVVDWQLSDTF